MRQNNIIKILGIFGTVALIISALFKIAHYHYSHEIQIIGLGILSVFIVQLLAFLLKSNKPIPDKVLWSIFIILLPIIGGWVYYFKIRRESEYFDNFGKY